MSRISPKTLRVAVGLLLAAGLAGFLLLRRSNAKPDLRFETATVEKGRLEAKVTASGTVSALVTVQVGSQVSGRLQAILVDFNSPVKKGQVIAKIDPQLFEAALEQARANYVAAEANLTKAKVQAVDAERQHNRSKSLAERQLIAQADLDTAQATLDSARAQVAAATGSLAQARAGLNQAQVNLAYTTILSPIDGIVISRSVDVGQTVAASFQAPTLFVIAEDLRKMQVDTNVAEADIGKLRPGMSAHFGVDAYPGERFRGTVRQIRNAAVVTQNVVTYDAVIDVENADLKLRPGMTANVTFVYAEKDDVLRVPNMALRFNPSPELLAKFAPGAKAGAGSRPASAQGRETRGANEEPGRRKVWILRGTTPEPVAIRTGISDGTVTELVEGELKDGDKLVVDITGAGASAGGGNNRRRPPGMF